MKWAKGKDGTNKVEQEDNKATDGKWDKTSEVIILSDARSIGCLVAAKIDGGRTIHSAED
jgi:hypothetical protein